MSINQPPIINFSEYALQALSNWNLELANETNRLDAQLKDVLSGGKVNIEGDYVIDGTLKTSKIESDAFTEMFFYHNLAMNNNTDYTFTWIPSKAGQNYEAYIIGHIHLAGTMNAGMAVSYTVGTTGGNVGTWTYTDNAVGLGAINGNDFINPYGNTPSTALSLRGGAVYTTTMNINDVSGYTSARGIDVLVFARCR